MVGRRRARKAIEEMEEQMMVRTKATLTACSSSKNSGIRSRLATLKKPTVALPGVAVTTAWPFMILAGLIALYEWWNLREMWAWASN
jgi:hypothetical protein